MILSDQPLKTSLKKWQSYRSDVLQTFGISAELLKGAQLGSRRTHSNPLHKGDVRRFRTVKIYRELINRFPETVDSPKKLLRKYSTYKDTVYGPLNDDPYTMTFVRISYDQLVPFLKKVLSKRLADHFAAQAQHKKDMEEYERKLKLLKEYHKALHILDTTDQGETEINTEPIRDRFGKVFLPPKQVR